MGGKKSRPPPPPPDPIVERTRNERDSYYRERDRIYNQYKQYINLHFRSNYDQTKILEARGQEQQIADERAKVAAEEAKRFQETTINNTVNIINNDINPHINKKNIYFNNQNQIIYNTFTVFAKKTTAEKDDLISMMDKQNKQIQKQLQKIKQEEKENNRQKHIKAEYVSIEIDKMLEKNKILFYIYYFLLFISMIVIYFNAQYKNGIIIGLFILLIIYPFVIYYLELFVYNVFMYLYVLYQSTPLYNGMLNM
jgi:preprotein translocase subunit SecF